MKQGQESGGKCQDFFLCLTRMLCVYVCVCACVRACVLGWQLEKHLSFIVTDFLMWSYRVTILFISRPSSELGRCFHFARVVLIILTPHP